MVMVDNINMRGENKLISLILPVYNEEDVICEMVSKLNDFHPERFGTVFEVVIVDDGSKDGSWRKIEELSRRYENVRGVSFSRHFGKEAALVAGLAYSKGDAIVTIDSDMQHPIDKIGDFIICWQNGAKVVEGIKVSRGKENRIHRALAGSFYGMMSLAIGQKISNSSDFKLLDREVVDVILKMPEKQMFYRAITSWVGFETNYVEYEVLERQSGKSKWSPFQLFLYAIRNITSFSSAPLQMITIFAILFFVLAVVEGILVIIKLVNGTAVEGFATVILLQLISGAIIMFALGLIGYYISKLFDEARGRPRFIVEKETGREEKNSV